MSFNLFCKWSPCIVFVTAAVCSMPAYAEQPAGSLSDANMISFLQLSSSQISHQELDKIRGGFDLNPGLSISFAFQQVDYQGTKAIQSIFVPLTKVTNGAGGAVAYVAGGDTTTLTQQGAGGAATINVGGNTIQLPAGAPSVTLSSTLNNGATVLLSSLGSNGISNMITNMANNTMLSQVTTMNFEISGMSQWLAQQVSGFGGLGFSR